MGNGYAPGSSDETGQREVFGEIYRRLRELEALDGSQIYDALQQIRDLIDGVIAATNITVPGNVTAGGYGSFGGDIVMGGNLYTPSGRATPVVTSYVAAYLNSDGRLGATPSGRQFKQDILPRKYTLEDCRLFQVVQYRLIAAVELMGDEAAVEVGVIAQDVLAAGFPEFVVCDEFGTPVTVTYERMVVAALGGLQDAADRLDAIDQRLDAAGI